MQAMKKINILLLIGVFLATRAMSQTGNSIKIGLDKRSSPKQFTAFEKPPGLRLNDININAVRDLNMFFKNPVNLIWEKIPNGYVAHFRCNDIKMMVAYSHIGTWVHTISYYDEFKLPVHIRHLVKSMYYDFVINQVVQLEEDDRLIYMVQMEDSTSFKTIMVSDEGMETVKDIKKSK